MSQSDSVDDGMLTRQQAAEYCGVPAAFLRSAWKKGIGPTVFRFTQKTVRYDVRDLDAWKSSRRVVPQNA